MTEKISFEKNRIREKILLQRVNLDEAQKVLLSKNIIENFIKTDLFKNFDYKGMNISLYNAFKGEPDLTLLRDIFVQKGAICFYPVTLKNEIKMSQYFPEAGKNQFMSGRLGILEPSQKIVKSISVSVSCNSAHSAKMDLVIIPGIAFDVRGNRIGFGKGYYDRYLSGYESGQRPYIAALIYDFQLLDNIPADENDIPVDFIITEKRTVNLRSRVTTE